MVDRQSPDYVKSTFRTELWSEGNETSYSRRLEVEGNSGTEVHSVAEWVRGRVMP